MFNGKIHYKWPFSIAMLVHQRVSHLGFVRFRFLDGFLVHGGQDIRPASGALYPTGWGGTLEQWVVEEKWGASPTKCFWGMAMMTRAPRELRSLQRGTDHRNPCWAGC